MPITAQRALQVTIVVTTLVFQATGLPDSRRVAATEGIHSPSFAPPECTWESITPGHTPFYHSADTASNGHSPTYVLGGLLPPSPGGEATASAKFFRANITDTVSAITIDELPIAPYRRYGAMLVRRTVTDTDEVILFGGGVTVNEPGRKNEAAIFNVRDNSWRTAVSEATSPRLFGQAYWEPVNDLIVVVGGADSCSSRRSLSYEVECEPSSAKTGLVSLVSMRAEDDRLIWERSVSGGPTVLYGHSMIHDSKENRLIVFGGLSEGLRLSNRVYEMRLDGEPDEWEWSLLATVGPIARAFHRSAYDADHNAMIMHGGLSEVEVSADDKIGEAATRNTYVLDLNEDPPVWSRLDSSAVASIGASIASNSTKARYALFSGRAALEFSSATTQEVRDAFELQCVIQPPTPTPTPTPLPFCDDRKAVRFYRGVFHGSPCFMATDDIDDVSAILPIGSICPFTPSDWDVELFPEKFQRGTATPVVECLEDISDYKFLSARIRRVSVEPSPTVRSPLTAPPPTLRATSLPPPTETMTSPTTTATTTATATSTEHATPIASPTVTATETQPGPTKAPKPTETPSTPTPSVRSCDHDGIDAVIFWLQKYHGIRRGCVFLTESVESLRELDLEAGDLRSVCLKPESMWSVGLHTEEGFGGRSRRISGCDRNLLDDENAGLYWSVSIVRRTYTTYIPSVAVSREQDLTKFAHFPHTSRNATAGGFSCRNDELEPNQTRIDAAPLCEGSRWQVLGRLWDKDVVDAYRSLGCSLSVAGRVDPCEMDDVDNYRLRLRRQSDIEVVLDYSELPETVGTGDARRSLSLETHLYHNVPAAIGIDSEKPTSCGPNCIVRRWKGLPPREYVLIVVPDPRREFLPISGSFTSSMHYTLSWQSVETE